MQWFVNNVNLKIVHVFHLFLSGFENWHVYAWPRTSLQTVVLKSHLISVCHLGLSCFFNLSSDTVDAADLKRAPGYTDRDTAAAWNDETFWLVCFLFWFFLIIYQLMWNVFLSADTYSSEEGCSLPSSVSMNSIRIMVMSQSVRDTTNAVCKWD